MEIDVNLAKSSCTGTIEPLMTISAGSYTNSNTNNNNITAPASTFPNLPPSRPITGTAPSSPITQRRPTGCCGILSRLLCTKRSAAKTASSSSDYNNLTNSAPRITNNGNGNGSNNNNKKIQHRRTPQEIYFESRGKSCKKLLKFNGNSNKILLYPEEGWARTASSSYWTITPCWWQPNRCFIEEFSGTQRNTTKAKMVPLEQSGSLLIAGHFSNKKMATSNCDGNSSTNANNRRLLATATVNICANRASGRSNSTTDEFKLYLTSNISIEDYNMGYCLTGFVERRCQHTNTFQMTHFAVIKRQWPSIGSKTEAKDTAT